MDSGYYCKICNASFSNAKEMVDHFDSHHKAKSTSEYKPVLTCKKSKCHKRSHSLDEQYTIG